MEHYQSEFQTNLGQMLRMQRKNAGLSQSETAKKLGISRTSYCTMRRAKSARIWVK